LYDAPMFFCYLKSIATKKTIVKKYFS